MYTRLLALILFATAAIHSTASGQFEEPVDDGEVAVPPPPCRAGQHQPVGCDAATLTSILHYVTLSTTIDPVGPPTKKAGMWHGKGACNCFYSACDDPRRHPCGPVVALYSRQEQTCWKVTGGASVQVKTGLLEQLFAELSLTVSVGAELTGCTTVTQGLTFEVPGNDCFTNYARDVWWEQVVVGHTRVAEAAYFWDCQRPKGLIVTVGTYCNVYEANGKVDTMAGRLVEYSQLPVPCGGPADPINGEPYMRSEKCCAPMVGCDETDPPTPCCGCWVPQ